jgi:hypothetical protein
MTRTSQLCLALLAGVALIWLVQFAAAAITLVPGLVSLMRWLRENNLPLEIVSLGVAGLLPVFGAALAVGLAGFQLRERKGLVFICLGAPFVAYSLYANVGLSVSAGNPLAVALADPIAWLVVLSAVAGLASALVLSARRSAA